MEFWKELLDDPLGRIIISAAALVIVFLGLAVRHELREEKDWQVFQATHDCKVVGRVKGHYQTGVGMVALSKGGAGTTVITTRSPDQTGFLCNDGITYWR